MSTPKPQAKHAPRRVARALFYAGSWLFFIAWLALGFSYETQRAAWLCGWAWAILLVLWCREDALIAGRPLPTMSLWVVLLFWPLAVPICVVRLRGLFYGLLLVVLHTLVYAAGYGLAAAQAMQPY